MTTAHEPLTLVTGGTGTTGRRVAALLTAAGRPVRIASRGGPTTFDWHEPDTWAGAVDGVAAAYLAYAPDIAFPGAADTIGRFARFAAAGGVRRLVLLSGRGEPGAQRAEDLVRGADRGATIVRSAMFAQNFTEGFLRGAVLDGVLAMPAADVSEPFVDVDDIAAVAIAALTDDCHAGEVYEVTGPRSLTFGAALALIGAAAGHDVRYLHITPAEMRAALVAEGLPPDDADGLVDLFGEILDGRNSSVADGVQRALGRAPRDLADVVAAAAAAGAWDEGLVHP